MRVLCVNGGSSSLKVALYAVGNEERRLAQGQASRLGQGDAVASWGEEAKEGIGYADHAVAMRWFATRMGRSDLPPPHAIAHRIVHGGDAFDSPRVLARETLAELQSLVPLAPLHLPHEIALLETCGDHWPDLPQVLCFDTAFHRRMPRVAQRLPLPRSSSDEGVRRYGFHGLSYEYVLETLAEEARGRAILAHLGAGASLAATLDGEPVDTTMGFTPAGGLMMATRTGDLDPGVLVYLMREKGYEADTLDELVNEKSGLLGVSGESADMATLLAAADKDDRAREAIESFCYIARKHIGAMAAALDGVDLLVFTAGIGQGSPEIRARICEGLGYLGVRLDIDANARNADCIGAPDASCRVRVLPTNEEIQIARSAFRRLKS